MTPLVDLIIPIHDPRRPVGRAVTSVLRKTTCDVRVSVVVHNTSPEPIEALLADHRDDPRLRLLTLDDGIRSPAGPFNLGLERATGRYTSVMGSDDELEPGAIDSWVRLADHGAEVVVSRLRFAGGRAVPTPATRPLRRRRLDPVRDRLSYRSAPLGLVSRERFGAIRFPAGVSVGSDIPYVSELWFSGASIAYDRRGPAYVIHDDANDRVTFARRAIDVQFSYLTALTDGEWLERLDAAQRRSLAIKLVRIHLFGFALYAQRDEDWPDGERTAFARVAREMLAIGPGAEQLLSRADRVLLDAILDPDTPVGTMAHAAVARRRFGRLDTLVPRHLRDTLRREAPLRFSIASAAALYGV